MKISDYIKLDESIIENKVLSFLKTDKAYEILDSTKASGSTWAAGGCAILAFALKKAFGYPVYVILNNNTLSIEHFVSKVDSSTYMDSYGESKNILIDFKKREMIKDNLSLMPYSSNLNLRDIVIDHEASDKLAEEFLKG